MTDSISLTIRLYDETAAPAVPLFVETHADVGVNNGLFSILIGSITSGGVPDTALAPETVSMGVTVDDDGELTPRTTIVSVPYAIIAGSAKRLVRPDTVTPAVTVDASGNVGIGTTVPDATAAVDISSTSAGLLIPRMSTTDRVNINSPAVGLQIYGSSAEFVG